MGLVFLAPVSWASFSQRPHRFVEWFHQRTNSPVLWVDPYPTRLPRLSDIKKLRNQIQAEQANPVPSWLTVLKPSALPIEPLPGSTWINHRVWRPSIHQIVSFAKNTNAQVAIGKPSLLALEVLQLLPRSPSLYDAMDEFSSFYTGLSKRSIAKRESQIIGRVDKVFASSRAIQARLEKLHPNVRLVPNGMDSLSVRASKRRVVPDSKNVFGFVGTIAAWFDWKWVIALATARPNDEIRLIGPLLNAVPGPLPFNIRLCPACDHSGAMDAMAQFNVGIIPFKNTSLTASVDPVKFYEYVALGLPVLSTDFGEMSQRINDPGVFIAKNENEIPLKSALALHYSFDEETIRIFIGNNCWGSRFDNSRLFHETIVRG